MFINTTAFKRLIKDTYNTTGLTVGATEEEYFFEGRTGMDAPLVHQLFCQGHSWAAKCGLDKR